VQKGKEAVSLIIFRYVPHSVPRIELLPHCQKVLGDPTLLLLLYMVQSNVSPDAFKSFVEILGGAKPHYSRETFDGLMLVAR
jgi:hypothetical protein